MAQSSNDTDPDNSSNYELKSELFKKISFNIHINPIICK